MGTTSDSPREQRLVHVGLSIADKAPIGHHLVAGAHDQHVPLHDLARIDGLFLPIAQHRRRRAGQQGDMVEFALGSHLLQHADGHIDQHDAERDHDVARPPEHDQDQAEDEQRGVDEGEDVLAQDQPVGPAAVERRVVAQPLPVPSLSLDAGQAKARPGGGGGSAPGSRRSDRPCLVLLFGYAGRRARQRQPATPASARSTRRRSVGQSLACRSLIWCGGIVAWLTSRRS